MFRYFRNTLTSVPEDSTCYSEIPDFSEDNDVLSQPNLRLTIILSFCILFSMSVEPYYYVLNELLYWFSTRVDTTDYVDDSNEVESRLECLTQNIQVADQIDRDENLNKVQAPHHSSLYSTNHLMIDCKRWGFRVKDLQMRSP